MKNAGAESLRERIKRHEGLRLTPYRDSEGHWTVGIGHNMAYPISQAAADQIFEDDLERAVWDSYQLNPWMPESISNFRFDVLIEMIFQLGLGGVLKFKAMLEALKVGDYDRAADEILDSKAARQCPNRFREYATLMKDGGV